MPLDTAKAMEMRDFVAVARAISDPQRVRALLALRRRELCVCQIIELLGLAPSTVSKHLAILAQARLVESRKDGRWVYYRVDEERAPPEVGEVLAWVFSVLAADRTVVEDERRLEKILAVPPQFLCRERQGRCR